MITVMIPCLNEERNLSGTVVNLISAAKKAGNVSLDMVIINDGSTDRTGEVIEKLEKKYKSIRHITHSQNKGIGTSLREVIKIAKYPKFMLIPGDNLVEVELLTNLLRYRNKADLIVSYFLNKEIRTPKRNFISGLFSLIYVCTFDTYVQYLNSVCVYPTALLRKMDIKSSRFSICAEMNIKLLRTGCTYFEFPGLYMKAGITGNTSFSFRNLLEVIGMYFRMVYEIYFAKKEKYKYRPKRVYK